MTNERWHAECGRVLDENRLIVCEPSNRDDAPLIAAAPAMLDIVRRVVEYAHSQTRSEPLANIERDAVAVLDSAEGR